MKTDAMRTLLVRSVFWFYAGIWTVLLLVPDPVEMFGVGDMLPDKIAAGSGGWDKLVHGTGYLLLMAAAGFAYGATRGTRPPLVAAGWLFLGCLAHGAITEVLQWAMGERRGDFVDWLADGAGATLGAVPFYWMQRRTGVAVSRVEVCRQTKSKDEIAH